MKFFAVAAILFCAYLLKPADAIDEECKNFMNELADGIQEKKGNGEIGPECEDYFQLDKNGDLEQQMKEAHERFMTNSEEDRKTIRDCAYRTLGSIMEGIEDKPEKCMEELKKHCIFREDE